MDIKLLSNESVEVNEEVVRIRRQIHENPELSYREHKTAKLVADTLASYGIEVKSGVGGTGIVGLIRGKSGKVTVGLRADMDALPVNEETGLPFASKNPGVMHACGHDNHVAMLLGAACIIARHKDELEGNVKFLFQPAEEDGGRGGALPMIEDGALENPHVDHVFGLHVSSEYPAGVFALRPGALMAAPDAFEIKIRGRGGHGSAPHDAVDPIFIGNQVISTLYGIRSRWVDQREPLVISVCSVHSGTKDNIIPDEMVLAGTVRTFDETIRGRVKELIRTVSASVGSAYGARVQVSFKENTYPVTYNDPATTEKVKGVLSKIEGARVIETKPVMGAEDVSRFLEKAPGTFYFLGTRNESKGLVYPNHSSKFTFDEEYLRYGVLSHVLIALEFAGSK
jgi:carboxypeptidase Ss1